MNRSERAIVIILRIVAITGLFAIPPIFFPYAWMNTIHGWMGLGELEKVVEKPDVERQRSLH